MATRVKDGIFVADGESSQDPEFVEMSKIGYAMDRAGTGRERRLQDACVRSGERACSCCRNFGEPRATEGMGSQVINCAGRELPNLWAPHGVRYLTFSWDDEPGCPLFDARDARRCVAARAAKRSGAFEMPLCAA
mmetsp:Transcript_12174/g.37484  ORF Transcript_12174/g.37484 Transcript_12174/m.37484 type:complete len:135 (-) Transcript_12174:1064-1468(-)